LGLVEIVIRFPRVIVSLRCWAEGPCPVGADLLAGQQQAVTELDSDTWVGKVKRIRGKHQPLTAVGVQSLRGAYTRQPDANPLEHAHVPLPPNDNP
jgi:hypothetical protein